MRKVPGKVFDDISDGLSEIPEKIPQRVTSS